MLAALSLIGAACGDDDDTTAATDGGDTTETTDAPEGDGGTETTVAPEGDDTTSTAPATDGASGGDLEAIHQACLDEGGQVNLIALPDEWAGYEGILASFRDKYPDVANPVANPNASSADELEAVQTLAGQDDQPDSVDVSPAIAQEFVDLGLFEPYELSLADEVPAELTDPDHNWYAAYYGIIAILTNTTIVETAPTTFAELAGPDYEGLVALNGDPRESGSAFAGVLAASIANGGSVDDILPGIEYFAGLKASGNLIGSDVTPETVLSGETPIAIDWSYNLPGLAAQLEEAGFTVETHFPSDGIYGGFYSQGVVADSPHQACSQLWLEHIFSNEGALGYLQGGAVPARIVALNDAGLVTDEVSANLPPAELLDQVSFLSPAQIAAAKDVLAENWGPMVADA